MKVTQNITVNPPRTGLKLEMESSGLSQRLGFDFNEIIWSDLKWAADTRKL